METVREWRDCGDSEGVEGFVETVREWRGLWRQ